MTAFTGIGPLIGFVLRRDRVFLPVWILAITVLTYASTAAVRRTYDTPAEMASYAVNVGGTPAGIAMSGPPVALTETGGILVYETSLTALLGIALMVVFTVVRHTREEEDAGRVELLGSTVVSPHAVILAAVTVAVAASLLVGAGVSLSFLVEEQPVLESLLYGSSVAAFGVVLTGVAACAAQLMSHGRGAVGLSLAFLGLAFGLRAIGDVGETFWSWLSPMGWAQQVRVYDDNRWWPLGLCVLLTAALLVSTVVLEARRDLGAGIVPARPGPAGAGRWLSGPVGLAWRVQRGALLGWVTGVAVMGLLLGSFSESIQNMVDDNPTLQQYFEKSGAASIADSFLATSLLLLAIGGSGFAVSSVLRARSEESSGHAEPLLASEVSRTRWLLAGLLVALGGAVAVAASGGLGVGVSYAASSGRPVEIVRMTGFALTYLPPVLLLAALGVVLVGWAPRAAGAAWSGVALAFVVGWLGGLLDLPAALVDLSPFSHVPMVPADTMLMSPLVVLTLLTAVAVGVGLVGFRRRDIG